MVIVYNAMRLRTLGQFTAPDPWRGGQVTQFSIEEYVMMPSGSKQATSSSQFVHRAGLRSEIDGGQHMIPESLLELWQRGQIPAERLPALAQAIGPRLVKDDFNLILHQSIMKTVVLPLIAVFVIIVLVGLYAPISSGNLSLPASLGLGAVFTIGCGAIFLMMRQSGRSRRVSQMQWLLAANSGLAAPPLAGRAVTQFKRFGMIFALLLGTFILIIGSAYLWTQYGRPSNDPVADPNTGNISMPVDILNSEVPTGTTTLVVVSLTGENVTIKIPPMVREGAVLRVPGKGVLTAKGTKGDLLLKVRVHH